MRAARWATPPRSPLVVPARSGQAQAPFRQPFWSSQRTTPPHALLLLCIWGATAFVAGAQTATPTNLDKAHWLLNVGEELHRSFLALKGVQVLRASLTGGSLCAQQIAVGGSGVSRRQYEDSWTRVQKAGLLESVYNGTCFTKSAAACEQYTPCLDTSKLFPTQTDPVTGLAVFSPEDRALEGLRWARGAAGLQAWQREEADLVSQLGGFSDNATESVSYFRSALIQASDAAAPFLRTDPQSLVAIANARAAAYVQSLTAPVLAPGSADLPLGVQQLASAIQGALGVAALQPCGTAFDWLAPHVQLRTMLTSQSAAIAGINASAPLRLDKFDYTRRTVEALVVGAALAMQASALAAFAQFQCAVRVAPRGAAVIDLSALRDAAGQLLQALSAALPPPSDGTAASAPLQQCLAGRVGAAAGSLSLAMFNTMGAASPLLSLDFCARVFEATAFQAISVVPYTDAPPPAAPTPYVPQTGEQRVLYADPAGQLAYLGPYAGLVARSAGSTSAFAANDKVVQLKAVPYTIVNSKGAAPTSVSCSRAVVQIQASYMLAPSGCAELPSGGCPTSGCVMTSQMCLPATLGFYGDGVNEVPCKPVTCDGLTGQTCVNYVAFGWPNSSCPFLCTPADRYMQDRACVLASNGYYSPACNNSQLPCTMPTGVPADLNRALVRFTSSGQGVETGCEARIAFPLVRLPRIDALAPPFTLQLYIQVAPDAIRVATAGVPSLAILAGVFPRWFIGICRASSTSVYLTLWHHQVTRAMSSRQDSLVYSEAIPWSSDWHHIAVVVTGYDTTLPNILFYADGAFVSSARRSATAAAVPFVSPDQSDVFHVGPPNLELFPEVLQQGRTEPYFYDGTTAPFFDAQVDEVRVSRTALQILSLGSSLTEMRLRQACDVPVERLTGSTCQPVATYTQQFAVQDQTSCQDNYEPCGARPGLCVAQCMRGTLRQAGCTCDCRAGDYQTWFVQVVYLLGSGGVGPVAVYDSTQRVVANLTAGSILPLQITLQAPTYVSVVTVRGGGTATTVSLDVQTATGMRFPVPAYRNVPLLADRDIYLHHRPVDAFFDVTLACSPCPGQREYILGSRLPRQDALSCLCLQGYGRDLLGRCVPRLGPLPRPLVTPAGDAYYSAGTRVRLQMPAFVGQGAWLLEIRHTIGFAGSTPPAPDCMASAVYVEPAGVEPGLDVIRRTQKTTVRAVLCHPMYQDSPIVDTVFFGNNLMNPPWCSATGTLSTATAYALQVTVALLADQPNATLKYAIGGAQYVYAGPFVIAAGGATTLRAWAEAVGFDPSADTQCTYTVEVAARLGVKWQWQDEQRPTIGGFSNAEGAWMVNRGVDVVRLALAPFLPGGSAPSTVQVQYRLKLGAGGAGNWQDVPTNGSLSLSAKDILQPPMTATTVVRVEWRAKEPGYVWTNPAGLQLLFVATRSAAPAVEAVPVRAWAIGDNWFPGSARDNALRQVHRVTLSPPTAAARLLFVVGAWQRSDGLLAISQSNTSSLRDGGLVEVFNALSPSPDWSPEDFTSRCSPTPASELPRLCEYLGPFQALGGITVTAFTLEQGVFESLPAVLAVPRELEPAAGDPRFLAAISLSGPKLSVSTSPGVAVLPSTSTQLTISLGLDDAARQTCVLVSPFTYSGAPGAAQSVLNCSWLAYNNPILLSLQKASEKAGLAGSVTSLNITVLSSVHLDGFLWAYPQGQTYLWLREQAKVPALISVVAPGAAAVPAGMIWLRAEAGVDAVQQQSLDPMRCYFTINAYPLIDADLSIPWLAAVPAVTASVPTVRSAMQPTQVRNFAIQMDAWRAKPRLCAWPAVCEMLLNGTLPVDLVQSPADLPVICAWAVWPGHAPSPTTCLRLGSGSAATQVLPIFAPNASSASNGGGAYVIVGQDDILNAVVLTSATDATKALVAQRRLQIAAPAGVPIGLQRSFPLQVRWAALPLPPSAAVGGAARLLASATFSDWLSVELDSPDPVVPLPSSRQDDQHALLAVDVRLLIGIGRWSQQSRTFAVALLGQHPLVPVELRNRTVIIQKPWPNSTVLYRWILDAKNVPRAIGGGSVLRLRRTFPSILAAYELDPGIQRQLQDPSAVGSACLTPNGTALSATDYTFESTLGPRLCILNGTGAVSVVAAPDSRQWVLWVAAYGPGLALSDAQMKVVAAQCSAPIGISFAAPFACQEGPLIDSWASCTPQCQAGYTPSEGTLGCLDGALTPATFVCGEEPCTLPSTVKDGSCDGRMIVESGKACVPTCRPGFTPSEAVLACSKGIFEPRAFACKPAPIDPVPVIAGVSTGLAGLTFLAVVAVVLCRHRLVPQPKKEVPDALQDWWACVQEVEPGACVFCGRGPATSEGREDAEGPATIFQCCEECADVLDAKCGSEDGEADGTELDDSVGPAAGDKVSLLAAHQARPPAARAQLPTLLPGDLDTHGGGEKPGGKQGLPRGAPAEAPESRGQVQMKDTAAGRARAPHGRAIDMATETSVSSPRKEPSPERTPAQQQQRCDPADSSDGSGSAGTAPSPHPAAQRPSPPHPQSTPPPLQPEQRRRRSSTRRRPEDAAKATRLRAL